MWSALEHEPCHRNARPIALDLATEFIDRTVRRTVEMFGLGFGMPGTQSDRELRIERRTPLAPWQLPWVVAEFKPNKLGARQLVRSSNVDQHPKLRRPFDQAGAKLVTVKDRLDRLEFLCSSNWAKSRHVLCSGVGWKESSDENAN